MIGSMNVDFYDIGFVPSVPINGGHWYGDPFNLFTDYGASRISEPHFADSYPVVAYSTSTFFYIGNVGPAPTPVPTPVPEPSSLLLLFLAILISLGRRASRRAR